MSKLLYVKWDDHWTQNSPWVYKNPEPGDHYMDYSEYKPAECETVGFVIHEDKKAYYLSPMIGNDAHKMELCILKSCITKKKVLSVKSTPKKRKKA